MALSVSVIIPNYNHARYLEQRIDSVLRQTAGISEILILDDASTDNSLDVVAGYATDPRVRLLANRCNSGNVFAQWNKGLDVVSGDLVWIAESDDSADPLFLEKLLPFFQTETPGFAYCESRTIDAQGVEIASSYRDTQYLLDISTLKWRTDYCCDGLSEIRSSMAVKNTIPNVSAVLFKREALAAAMHAAKTVLQSFRMAGDWFLYIEILRRHSVAFCASVLNAHRRHEQSMTIHAPQTALALLSEVRAVHEHVVRTCSVPEECLCRMYDHELQHLHANPDMSLTEFSRIADWDVLAGLWEASGGQSRLVCGTFSPHAMDWMALPSKRLEKFGLRLSQGIESAWENLFSRIPQALDSPAEYDILCIWWLLRGGKEYPYVPCGLSYDVAALARPQAEAFSLPRWAWLFHGVARDLQEAFPLDDIWSASRYAYWLYRDICDNPRGNGPEEAKVFSALRASLVAWFAAPDAEILALPRLFLAFGEKGEGDIVVRAGLLCRGLTHGSEIINEFSENWIDGDSVEKLLLPVPGGGSDDDDDDVPLFYKGLMHWRKDAVAVYPHWRTTEELTAIRNWFCLEQAFRAPHRPLLNHILRELGGDMPPLETQKQPLPVSGPMCADTMRNGSGMPADFPAPCAGRRLFRGTLDSGGVNIIGFAEGMLGIGEDVRMAARAMREAGIPACVFSPPMELLSARESGIPEGMLSTQPVYRTNVFFMPAGETLRLYMRDGPGIFNARRNICAWQWELPHLPKALHRALCLGQEFWSASEYTASALREATDKSVLHMPMAVDIPSFFPLGRQHFTLPADMYLFLFIFDGFSHGARKNPQALLRAFSDAFPDRRDIGLVIKAMNADPTSPYWQAVLEAQSKHPGIFTINECWEKARLFALYDCCDAYVSLHRAEGFGRTMAEAMLMGKPVIATAYSGNADFTTAETAFPVEADAVPVAPDAYIFPEGQYWWEVHHDAAVEALRRCVNDVSKAESIALRGQKFIQEHYSIATVKEQYNNRLRDIVEHCEEI